MTDTKLHVILPYSLKIIKITYSRHPFLDLTNTLLTFRRHFVFETEEGVKVLGKVAKEERDWDDSVM